jgi:hypothetical protein
VTYFQAKQERHHHRPTLIDADTGEKVCWCGKTEAEIKNRAPKKNKFNATKSNYNGYIYDSGKEAKYAAELDLLKKAGKIKAWDRQFIIEVAPEGKTLFRMKVDFRVHNLDDSYELHEVKSWITERDATYRLKRKAIELYWLPKHPDHSYHVIQ